jgi:hypothetical protein
MVVLLRMRSRAVINPKFGLAESKYRHSEKSGLKYGAGGNNQVH